MMEKQQSVLNVGDKVHVITRRLYDNDIRRHFAGEVVAISDTAFRAMGYSFLFDTIKLEYRRLESLRSRIFPIADSAQITNVLPRDVAVDQLAYQSDRGSRSLFLTDGSDFRLDMNDFGTSM